MTIITDTDGFWVRWQREFVTGTGAAEDIPAVPAVVLQKQSQNEHSCLKTASGREISGLGNCFRVHLGRSTSHQSPALPAALPPAQGAIPAQLRSLRGRELPPPRPGTAGNGNRSRGGRGPGCGGRAAALGSAVPARPAPAPGPGAVPHRGPGTESAQPGKEPEHSHSSSPQRELKRQYYFLGGKCQIIPHVFMMPTRFGIEQVPPSPARVCNNTIFVFHVLFKNNLLSLTFLLEMENSFLHCLQWVASSSFSHV